MGQSTWTIQKTGNIWYTRRRKTQTIMCWTLLYANKR